MKTVKFYKNGNIVKIIDYDDQQITDALEPAIYTIGQDMFGGLFLSYVSNRFQVPDKIYGSTSARAEKVLKTYDSRKCSTGVLMTGDKGSGKTMLSSLVSNKMLERGLPVILIEKPFKGSGFIDLLTNLGECVLFFDEFAKIFAKTDKEADENESQNGLLSIFDGTHSTKRLILLTENETHGINSYMLNRPGRIFYHFKYQKLEETLVREYCNANNIPEDITNAILLRVESSQEFSFDALKAVVEEYNRYKEDVKDIFSNLNIEEGRSFSKRMKIIKIVNLLKEEEIKPLNDEIESPEDGNAYLNYYTGEKDSSGRPKVKQIFLSIKDIVERTSTQQIYKIEDENILVILEKIQEPFSFKNYTHYFAY